MDKYLSIITNFGCHYKCPYCIVKENNLQIPKTTLEGLRELDKTYKECGCNIISISGGGDPLHNYDKHFDWYRELFKWSREYHSKHNLCYSNPVPIEDAVNGVLNAMKENMDISDQTLINLPARIRMSTLYAVSQSMNGRVANTCNLSEDWVGYSTRYGDAAGDFSPLSNLTVTEIKQIGRVLGLPDDLIDKVPSDGLCGKTDEDNLGFTYDALDRYIRTGEIEDGEVKKRIDTMHEKNLFKLQLMPSFHL